MHAPGDISFYRNAYIEKFTTWKNDHEKDRCVFIEFVPFHSSVSDICKPD